MFDVRARIASVSLYLPRSLGLGYNCDISFLMSLYSETSTTGPA